MQSLSASRRLRSVPVAVLALAAACFASPARDPLPSWNEGSAKRDIIAFVERVSTPGSADFVRLEERIATFDNDGTMWVEKPMPTEVYFVLNRLRELAADDSSWSRQQPFKAALAGDAAYFHEVGALGVLPLVLRAESGMTQEQFALEAHHFLATRRHPDMRESYTALVYQPMLELMRYLRQRGFQIWLCSGGTTDFMRAFASSTYGVSRDHVIGSELSRESRVIDGTRVIWRLDASAPPNDKELKPVNIDEHIGRRPLFAAGNVASGGDIAMLEYSRGRAGPSLQLLVHHDDATREYAYEERDGASLRAASTHGFVVVSMQRDWKIIFSPALDSVRSAIHP